jgi:hypothetical protein
VRVEQHDGVAEQVDRRLEAGAEEQHHRGVQLAVVQRVVVGRGDQPADQVLTRVAAQPVEVTGQEVVQRPQGALAGQEAAQRQAGVQGRREGGTPAQEVLLAVGRDAQQVGDHQDGQRGGEGRDQVHRLAAGGGGLQGVEQGVGDLPDHRLGSRGRTRREGPAHQPAVAGVVRRVDDEHRRGLGDAGRRGVVAEGQRPAGQSGRSGPVEADAEAIGPQHLRRHGVRRGERAEGAAHQRAAGAELLVQVVRVGAQLGVAQQAGDEVAAARLAGQVGRRHAVLHRPAGHRAGRAQGPRGRGAPDHGRCRRPHACASPPPPAGDVGILTRRRRARPVGHARRRSADGGQPAGSAFGSGAWLASPFQSLPASSACSEMLSVCSATVRTISSSESPSPAL